MKTTTVTCDMCRTARAEQPGPHSHFVQLDLHILDLEREDSEFAYFPTTMDLCWDCHKAVARAIALLIKERR